MRIKGLSNFTTPAPGLYDPLVCAMLSSFSDSCASAERREEDKERSSKLLLWSATRPRQEGRSGSKRIQCADSQAGVIILHYSDCSMSPIFRTDGPAFSLAPRMKAEKVYVTPAPSTYDMRKPEVVRVRAPAYSLAGRFYCKLFELKHFLHRENYTLGN